MKLRWMESGVVTVTSRASIKHMARDWKKNKGQKAGGDCQGDELWERGRQDTQPRRRESKKMWWRWGKRKNCGREKNSSAEVIYASCIIFYNAAPSPSPTALLSSPISNHPTRVCSSSLSHQGTVPDHTSQWLRFCRDATAALRKWKTGHNFPKMLFFITYFPFISLLHTIDSWWHLWQLNVFMARFMGYLLLSFYSSNSVKMLISQIRRGRVCVCVWRSITKS